MDWYKTQYGTGYANCGPALVSMAILWSRGQDMPVQDIREEIGYPYDDGAVSFDNLSDSLGRHKVPLHDSRSSPGRPTCRKILDRGHIALVLIQSGDIEKVHGDPVTDLVGRYYDDDEGHYVLVKGYTLDKGYFVVYDPYPVDWESNSLRYGDEVSMIGKNRYYPAQPALQRAEDSARSRGVVELIGACFISREAQGRGEIQHERQREHDVPPVVTERMLASGVASTENAPLIAHAHGMRESEYARQGRGAQRERPPQGQGKGSHEQDRDQRCARAGAARCRRASAGPGRR